MCLASTFFLGTPVLPDNILSTPGAGVPCNVKVIHTVQSAHTVLHISSLEFLPTVPYIYTFNKSNPGNVAMAEE